MRAKIDKIIALGGSTLIGYYLGLSIFHGSIWRLLQSTLPPMNNRHLPRFYTGLMGAFIVAPIGYLLYIWFIEKYSIKEHKKQYIFGVLALLILPVMTLASFRIQSVNYVRRAEATNPTSIHLRMEEPNIAFEINEGTASIFGKGITNPRLRNEESSLQALGEAIRQMEVIEVSKEQKNFLPNSKGTMWIEYSYQGNWYSKILNWEKDRFQEAGSQFILYKGEELQLLLEDYNRQLATLANYTSGKVIHTSLIDDDDKLITMSQKDLDFLLKSLDEENKTTPSDDIAMNFEEILKERRPITKKDTHLFAFSLESQWEKEPIILENVILYDNERKIAWFEDNYYHVDLSSILE